MSKNSSNQSSGIIIPEGFIIDFIDGIFRKDNPEEYVRQQIERSIVKEYSYPKEIIKIENSVKLGSQRKRVDIAILTRKLRNLSKKILRL